MKVPSVFHTCARVVILMGSMESKIQLFFSFAIGDDMLSLRHKCMRYKMSEKGTLDFGDWATLSPQVLLQNIDVKYNCNSSLFYIFAFCYSLSSPFLWFFLLTTRWLNYRDQLPWCFSCWFDGASRWCGICVQGSWACKYRRLERWTCFATCDISTVFCRMQTEGVSGDDVECWKTYRKLHTFIEYGGACWWAEPRTVMTLGEYCELYCRCWRIHFLR